MDLTAFLDSIRWITALDPEPEIYAQRDAVYADFFASVNRVAKNAPNLVCIDLHKGDNEWIAWEDTSSEDLDRYADELQRFRCIVTVD